MTIKQQGGVFGRNPDFNDVGVNDLTASGDVRANTLQSTSDTTVGGTLLANAARIFNATLPILKFQNNSTGQGGSDGFWIYTSGTTGKIVNFENAPVEIEANGQARLICSAIGDVSIPNGNLNMTVGNVVMSNGKGIDFSATAGTGTSELFDDYEEGTWTPTFSAEFTTPPTVTSTQYTKIGRQVTVTMLAVGGVVTAGGSIGGLPFASNAAQGAGAYGGNSDTTESLQGTVGQSASSITNIPARTLTGDTWQITTTYFT